MYLGTSKYSYIRSLIPKYLRYTYNSRLSIPRAQNQLVSFPESSHAMQITMLSKVRETRG